MTIFEGDFRAVGAPTIASITIGGILADIDIETRNTANQLTSSFICHALTGGLPDTADIVLSLSTTGATQAGGSLRRAISYGSPTPYQTGTAQRTSTAGTMSPSLNNPTVPGFVVSTAYAAGGTNRKHTSGMAVTGSAASLTITVDCQAAGSTWTAGVTGDVDITEEAGGTAVMSASSAAWAYGGAAPVLPSGAYIPIVVAGQSNNEGRGQVASSPAVTVGTSYFFNGAIYSPLADPVGGASTGSCQPALANRWTTLSAGAQKTVFREMAVGGTSCLTNETPNWSPTGTLLPAAVAAFNVMRANLAGISGVTIPAGIWTVIEGETAARIIRDGGSDATIYEAAFGAFVQNAKDNCPGLDYIFVSELGPAPDGTLTTAYAAVRTAQANVAAAKAFVKIVYTGAKSFTFPATMNADLLHYNQAGLNLVGAGIADGGYPVINP